MKFWRSFFILILIALVIVGCARKVPRISTPSGVTLSPVSAADIDFADDLDVASLDLAIERSLHYFDSSGRNNVYRIADRLISTQQMKESLLAFRQIIKDGGNPADKKKMINQKFNIYRAKGQDGSGGVLFTGYYEPLLEGSLTPTAKYKYPLYMPPPNLLAKKMSQQGAKIERFNGSEPASYYSRWEIDADKVLQGKGLELVWVSDPVDLFFLHIQGSGKIKLEDGKMVTVSATLSNGRPFRSVTKYMLERGIISGRDSSYHNVKRILKGKSDHDLYTILGYNERYIFFRFVDKDPIGSLGEPVTPGRTIATDPDAFPEGALAFIRLSKHVLDQEGNLTNQRVSFSRFVLNQDKGSAIKGPGRVDLFCGFGENAESIAGTLKEKGELYFLIKK
jgi:membrane-bound lytic murein transglycosylase A